MMTVKNPTHFSDGSMSSARIHDLKSEGHDIKTEIKSVNGKRFAEYKLDRDTTQIDDNFKYH